MRESSSAALRMATSTLERHPLREEIHRSLMKLYQESGQRTLAIRQYSRCS